MNIVIKRLDHIQICIPIGAEDEARDFYVIRRERDYCPKCGGKLLDFYVDRNQRAFTDGELEAFKVLHPEDRSTFQKVKYCRQCRKAYRSIH